MEVIYSYSRKQAIEDGVLVDVSEMAREVRVRYPTAITSGVVTLLTPPKSNIVESFSGRLWDVLWMFSLAARKSRSDTVLFKVKIGRKLETLKAVCGPGDTEVPVITIMLPYED